MKRPMLVCGITTVIVCALLYLFECTVTVIPIAAASALFFCIIKRKSIKNYLIIPTVCAASIIALLSFLSYNRQNITPLLKYNNRTETVCGRVITTPQFSKNHIRFTLQAESIGDEKTSTKILVFTEVINQQEIKLYDYIAVNEAYITVPTDEYGDYHLSKMSDGILLTAQADSVEYLWDCNKTIPYYCLKFKEILTDKISIHMGDNNGALLTGMLFGDKSNLDSTVTQYFRNSGISHLLAVSGLHTSLWCGLLISLLSAFKIPQKPINAICLIFLVLFCIISGFTPSVVRASLMMSVILISPFFRRTPDSLNSLGLAVTVLLLINPYTVCSISFQLSACATLGVLIAKDVEMGAILKKLHIRKTPVMLKSMLSSFLISIFAGLFTMPVCAYYFGIFSLIAPVSNLLCVQLAFYGMIFGTVSTALSLINIPFIKDICIFLFSITEFILDIVIHLAKLLSSLKYCTLPIRKEYLALAILSITLLSLAGFSAYKVKKYKPIIKATAILSSVILVLCVLIPVAVPFCKNTLTVAYCEGGIQIVIRSGFDYAYIENTSCKISDGTWDALPKASCEDLKYYIPTFLSKDSISNISTVNEQYSTTQAIIPPAIKDKAKSYSIDLPENTVIDDSCYLTLSKEINIEIVDTSSIKYAIIRSNKETVFIHLYGDTDFSKYLSVSSCDIAIYNGKTPENLPPNVKTVILSTDDYDPIAVNKLYAQCKNIYITAKNGDIKIRL